LGLKLEVDVEFSEPPHRTFPATLLVERMEVGFAVLAQTHPQEELQRKQGFNVSPTQSGDCLRAVKSHHFEVAAPYSRVGDLEQFLGFFLGQ
jgi:hypothetical protein